MFSLLVAQIVSSSVKQAQWVHGSAGRFILPSLELTGFELLSFNDLLQNAMVPFCGALDRGIDIATGVNFRGMSALHANDFAKSFDFVLGYTTYTPEYETAFDESIYDPVQHSAKLLELIQSQLENPFKSISEFNKFAIRVGRLRMIDNIAYRTAVAPQISDDSFKSRIEKLRKDVQHAADFWTAVLNDRRIADFSSETIDSNSSDFQVNDPDLKDMVYLHYTTNLIDFVSEFLTPKNLQDMITIGVIHALRMHFIENSLTPSEWVARFDLFRSILSPTTKMPQFNQEQIQFMKGPSLLVVFGSSTADYPVMDTYQILPRPGKLGKEIDILITDTESNREILKSWLSKNKIQNIDIYLVSEYQIYYGKKDIVV